MLVDESWHHTAWMLANLYLASLGAPLLADDAPGIVGMSQETTCYVSLEYFNEQDPFADFIVHEAAHVFHNTKRGTIGLPETRRKEWLLVIAFSKRETFAYSCEAFSRIVERSASPADRRALAEEYAGAVHVPDDRVDSAAVADIVREAAAARNGWKVILTRCAPIHERSRTTSRASLSSRSPANRECRK